MKSTFSNRALSVFLLSTSVLFLVQAKKAWACACGCGIFDVGTSSMFPNSSGAMLLLGYDYMNQNTNWSGSSKAQAADNPDKEIRTHFLTLGGQYMLNRAWGAEFEQEWAARQFTTTDSNGNPATFNHLAFGDLRIRGIYTGFSPDMSSGLTFGLRLPTGDSTFTGFDPDTEIGSGSTDLLLGAYHLGSFTSDGSWDWFAQIDLDEPLLTQNGYLPGSEIDAVFGAYYNGISIGSSKIAPMVQLLGSTRAADHGGNPAADPVNTGYERLLIAPAAEVDWKDFRFFASVAFPIYQYVNGDQLVASQLFKTVVSYGF